jgi:hypothetical protein
MSRKSMLSAATRLSPFGTAVCLAVLSASLNGPAAAAVFGSDERVPLPQNLRAVGDKIGVLHDPRSHSVCTAFCVGKDIVATAAHCLYRTADVPPLRLSDIVVKLYGSHAVTHIAGTSEGAPEANVIAGSTRLNVHPPIDATRDWALVRLARPVCRNGGFKLSRKPVEAVMRLSEAGKVYNVAYHRDLPKWQPMFESGCAVKRGFEDADWNLIQRDFTNPAQLLLHTCDTGGASSGSPLLVDGTEGPEVVGINVGTYVQSKVIMLNGAVLHRFKSDDVANTGVNSLAFAASLDALSGADTLLSRREIQLLQARLAAKDLYMGPQDGTLTSATRIAIERFERASEVPVTGLATRALLQTLVGTSQVATGKIPAKSGDDGRPASR